MSSLAGTLDDIIRQVALQETTSDIVVKREVIREFIYRGAAILTDAHIFAPEVSYDGLDVQIEFPSDIEVDYPVAEGAVGKEGRITWTPFNLVLEKAEGKFKITDEAVIRQKQKMQYQTGVRKLAEAFALKKNYNILNTTFAGAGETSATGGAWDTNTDYVVSDINNAINKILLADAAKATMQDYRKMVVCLPIKAYNICSELTTINNIKTSFRDYMQTQYGLKIVPFKDLSTATGIGLGVDMLVVLGGRDTVRHGVYRGGAVPLTEEKRDGAAMKHIVRQYFATKVVPDSAAVATSSRVCTITAILGTA